VPDNQFLFPYLHECIGRNCCNPAHWQLRPKTWKRLEPIPSRAAPVSGAVITIPATVEIQNLPSLKICPNGHPMTPENTVMENRNGHPKARCRTCRQESWRKHSARRSAKGLHT
jgi:hypothetical protein